MIVVHDRPPLWDIIDKTFHVAGKPILFAWGDRIFNPEGVHVPKELHAHEEIHGARQLEACDLSDPVHQWWLKYIADPAFRLAEEIPAHRAEYLSFCKRHADRNLRSRALSSIAMKLAAPLYGSLVTVREARDLIMRRE